MTYNFDTMIDRKGTSSVKWDIQNPAWNGEGMIPLWVADMDFACPPEVTEAIIKRATHPIYGYPLKPDAFFSALRQWINKRFRVDVEESWMTSIPGIVPGIHVAIDAFTAVGDKVLIQTPVYHPFFIAVNNRGREVIDSPLLETADGHYEMDWDDLEAKLAGDRVKLMLLCSPHNPVGRVWTKEELRRLGEMCVKNGVIVIADEIHCDLVYEKGGHTPFYSLPEPLSQNSVTFMAPSKTFNLAGLFTSYLLSSNEQLLLTFKKTASSMGFEHVNLFGIEASIAAYQYGEPWLEELLVYLRGNAKYVHTFLAQRLPEVSMAVPQATYLGWMDFRKLGLSQVELNRLLRTEAKLGLHDGTTFGSRGAGFQRLNFGCQRQILHEAMDRLERAIRG